MELGWDGAVALYPRATALSRAQRGKELPKGQRTVSSLQWLLLCVLGSGSREQSALLALTP